MQCKTACPLYPPKADIDLFKLGLKFFYSLLGVGAQSRLLVWVSVCEINGKQQLFINLVAHAEKLCVSAQYFLRIRQDRAATHFRVDGGIHNRVERTLPVKRFNLR